MIAIVTNSGGQEVNARDEWVVRFKRLMKAELKRHDVTYEEPSRWLAEIGIAETEASITMKVNRGAFPTWFFCQHEGHRVAARADHQGINILKQQRVRIWKSMTLPTI
jgi:hypothetical protein